MDGVYRIVELGEADEARGFALVNFYNAMVKQEDWRVFLAAGASTDRETALIQDRRGYVHAVISSRPDHDLLHGRVLRARAVACSQTPGKLLHDTIIAAAEARARATGCGGVLMELASDPGADALLEASVRCAGFSRVSASFYRALPAT